jgi:hypothetical protein
MTMTPTTQFRIPSDLKRLFKDICTYNKVSMCEVVIHQIQSYIHKETRHQPLVRYLRTKETAQQTGLVQDNRGVWVKPETLIEEDDWRDNI